MIKNNIVVSIIVAMMLVLPAFSKDAIQKDSELKTKAYDVISEALFDESIHVNMKVDIFAIIASLLSNKDELKDDRSVIEKFYQDVIVNNDKSTFSVDIIASKEEESKPEEPVVIDSNIIEILKKALQNDNINMKLYALDIISKVKLIETLDTLVEMLQDQNNDDLELKSSLISAIGLIGNDSNVELLEKYLSDENLKVRLNTIQALGDINSEKSNAIIKNYLNDESLEVALMAAGILAEKGNEEAFKLLKEGVESPVALTNQKTLISMSNMTNPDVLPLLEIASKSEDDLVKAYVLEILAKIDSPESVKIAKTMISNTKLMPRALIAISQNSSDDVFKVYSKTIQSNNASEKTYTVAILTQVKDKRAIPVLKKALKDKNQNVRLGVAKILYTLDDKSGIPVLKEAVGSENPDISLAAAAFLGFIGDDYGKVVLQNAMHNHSLPSWQKLDVNIILEKLGDKSVVSDLGDLLSYQKPRTLPRDLYPSVDTLKKLLKNDSKWTRLNAAVMLTKLNNYECLSTVEELAQDQDLAIKTTSIRLLGRINDKHSLPILNESLDDDAVRVRVNAAEAILKTLNTPEDVNGKASQ